MNLSLTNLALGLMAASAAAAPVDYLREVKPLFAEHCYRCHGASQQKGGLRLDTAAFALKGGERGFALRPGKSADSLILQAVRGAHDSIPRMPYKKPTLSKPQIALLARWIDEGVGRGQQRGRPHLHPVRAVRHDQHLRRDLQPDAGVRVL